MSWLFSSALLVAACSGQPATALPAPDGVSFEREVYPLLLRDCAFSTCHGAPERFLRVLGPGRTRLDATTLPDDPATLPEVLLSYERARSLLATAEHPTRSLLLRKPLEESAGGQGHLGVDELGRNVYQSPLDPGHQVLARWATSNGPPPNGLNLPSFELEPAPDDAVEP